MTTQGLTGTNGVRRRRGANAETGTQKAVLDALRSMGVVAWRSNPIAPPLRIGERIVYRTNASGATGLSDICGVCPGGRFIAVEVKGPDTPLRPKQALFLDAVSRMGGLALVARTVGDVLRLRAAVSEVTWYGVERQFILTPEQRTRYENAALREQLRKAAKRKARRGQ